MKRNLLYVLALMASVTFFTACSDNDDPMIPPSDLNTTFGMDENTELTLNYGDTPLTGKQVKFETTDSKTATLTLTDVIPGEAQTVISNIQLVEGQDEYTFSGNTAATRASGTTLDYSGSVKKGALTLNLKVTMADPNGWAKTYGLAELTKGEAVAWNGNNGVISEKKSTWFTVSPCYSLVNMNKPSVSSEVSAVVATFNLPSQIRPALGTVLMQVLNSVSLESDGNITANYSSGTVQFKPTWVAIPTVSITPDLISSLKEGKSWVSSPKNLAYWFEKDGKLYIKLNISAIVAQAMSDNGQVDNEALGGIIEQILGGDIATIKSLIAQFSQVQGMEMLGMLANLSDDTLGMLLDLVKNGISLNVEVKDGHTYIYLDKEDLTPIMNDLPKFIPTIKELDPMGMGNMIVNILTGVSSSWKYVDRFDLGLDLIAK